MRIIIASDHNGFTLKQSLGEYLKSRGFELTDAGPSHSAAPVDYVDYARRVGRAVSTGQYDRGILVCGTGTGMSMAANKMPGIRATLCHNVYTAHMSRAHNNANVLCLGGNDITQETAFSIVDEWFNTDFEGEPHTSLLAKLDQDFLPGYAKVEQSARKAGPYSFRYGVALSPRPASFAPLLFSGRLDEGILAASRAGFDGIELSVRLVSDFSISSLDASLKKNKLSLIAIATGQSWTEDSICMCDTRPEAREMIAERMGSVIDLAAQFNAMVIFGGIRGRFTGTKAEQKLHHPVVVELMRRIIQYAESHSVTVVLEGINHYETNFVNTTAEGLALLDEIGLKTPRLLLDTYHMNIEETDMCAAIRSAGDRLGYIHFADSNRRAPGQGHTDFLSILQTLVDIGYKGCITDEILPLPDDATAMQQAGDFKHLIADR